MSNLIPLLALIVVGIACAFFRTTLKTWAIASAGALVAVAIASDAHWPSRLAARSRCRRMQPAASG